MTNETYTEISPEENEFIQMIEDIKRTEDVIFEFFGDGEGNITPKDVDDYLIKFTNYIITAYTAAVVVFERHDLQKLIDTHVSNIKKNIAEDENNAVAIPL